ncbi:salicylate hydroxylase [Roseibium hamelinense]|uniref:Salicylate hydroxylase n=1 Tax=Roseibium hamelinense TaxID=150831 RepID=A0A562TB45_9HYPH|nr:FAD-dependent monooxygenase [Roseibium hamelinense]MTI45113.1 FAD-binding protein [Roseibium hamelinense]TWI90528.1 salicylate hydroxylase [Roseibium hamelinense]
MPHSKDSGPIIISGAGIAGLTAALAARKAGYEVLVLERARELTEVGAGLQLSPNACHVLRKLGVLEDIRPHAVAPEAIRIRSGKTGKELSRLPLGPAFAERYGAPYWVVHRADLQRALVEKVKNTAGIDLWLSSEIHDVKQDDGRLTCLFETPDSTGWIDGTLLIAADGVWSKSRALIPGHNDARFSGRTAYRTTIPGKAVPWEMMLSTGLWLGPGAHLVHYAIRGGKELNIVALVDEAWTERSWSSKAQFSQLRPHFANWHSDAKELLALPEHWTKWALFAVDASGPWVHERTTLIGDAAHAMLPFVAQGAAMAIEDAGILGALLEAAVAPIPALLLHFQELRQSRVVQVQNQAETNAYIYHLDGPLAFGRNAFMRLSKPEGLQGRMDWIYSWTPDLPG